MRNRIQAGADGMFIENIDRSCSGNIRTFNAERDKEVKKIELRSNFTALKVLWFINFFKKRNYSVWTRKIRKMLFALIKMRSLLVIGM